MTESPGSTPLTISMCRSEDKPVRTGRQTAESATAGTGDEAHLRALVAKGLSSVEAEYRAASQPFEPLLSQLPNDPLREKIRHYLVGKVTGHRRAVTLHRASELHPETRI